MNRSMEVFYNLNAKVLNVGLMTLAKEHFFLCVDAQCVPRATLIVALNLSEYQTNKSRDGHFFKFNNHSVKQLFLIFDKVQENKYKTIS